MAPFRLVDDDQTAPNPAWKWDYYCLYDKAELGFDLAQFPLAETDSEYLVGQTH